MTTREMIITILENNENRKFKARELAEEIFKLYPKECEAKKEKSLVINTEEELIKQLSAEIGANRPSLQKKHPQLKTTEDRPKKYYWTSLTDEELINEAESDENNITEHSLYPLLSEYIHNELNILPKRIDEKKSKNTKGKKGNHWLYPDIVGLEDLTTEWTREIKDCVKETNATRAKIWSFEVKIKINRSNIREVFFQAVSNSSWSNYGYLVATEISGEGTMKELRLLAAMHGIGYIQINIDEPLESQIIIPAIEKPNVDWATADRITEENKDFRAFVDLVRQFYQTGNHYKSEWDIKK